MFLEINSNYLIYPEGFQHAQAHANSFARKDSLRINHLLIGKTALLTKRPKRPNPVMQAANKTNQENKLGRSRTFDTLAQIHLSQKCNVKQSQQDTQSNTISWSQVKLEKKRKKYQRKLSESILTGYQESNGYSLNENENENENTNENENECEVDMPKNEISSQIIDINSSNNNWKQQFVSKISNSSSNSSSSTELCDDEHLKDNDLGSSPEVTRKTPNQISNVIRLNNVLNRCNHYKAIA